MTTTHTQPAGCDLDSLEALALAYDYENGDNWYNKFELADGVTYEPAVNFILGVSPTTALALIAAARAAQAPQGDTRQGARTCTPADERMLFEAWAPGNVTSLIQGKFGTGYVYADTVSAWKAWQARAAQGAGTAPVGSDGQPEKPAAMLDERIDTLMREAFPNTKPTAAYRHFAKLIEREIRGSDNVPPINPTPSSKRATHPAPVSTAAATTASASGWQGMPPIGERESIMDVCGLPKLMREIIETKGSCQSLENLYSFIDEWADARVKSACNAPSRAADGQQGASRAALDKPVINGVDEAAFQQAWEHVVDAADAIDAGWLRRFVVAYLDSAEATSLAQQYSDMLRKICFEYSAGGYNSEGLMSPTTADAKIRWIIDDTYRAALARAPLPAQADEQGGAA